MADNQIDRKIRAEKDYVKGMSYQDIADKYEVSLNTVKSWKTRYGWKRKSKKEREAEKGKRKAGAPKGSINAKGNRGNKNARPPLGNQNNFKHGLFGRYIPKETLELMGIVQETATPSDMIWIQIQLQYAAIIRAQQIMFVADKDDTTRSVKKTREVKGVVEEEIENIFAWDKQATFLNAQSKAMAELRNLIKQFKDLAYEDDERMLKIEQMQLNIDKTKAEIDNMGNGNVDDQTIIVNDIDEMKRVMDEKHSKDN